MDSSSKDASPSNALSPNALSLKETEHRIFLSGGTILACFMFIGLITTVALFGGDTAPVLDTNKDINVQQLAAQKERNESNKETLRWLTTATFPMFSSWIGIVLAFYFASGATRATNEGYQRLLEDANSKIIASGPEAEDKLKALKLSSQAKGLTFFETDLKLDLVQIKKKIEDATPRQRLLILNESDSTYRAIVTLSDISSFLVDPNTGGQGGAAGPVSLEDYLGKRPKESEQEVIFSSPTESVFDARAKMLNQKITNLIVTETGESNSKVIAYLTSSDIEALRP
jgi:hypothetical protein